MPEGPVWAGAMGSRSVRVEGPGLWGSMPATICSTMSAGLVPVHLSCRKSFGGEGAGVTAPIVMTGGNVDAVHNGEWDSCGGAEPGRPGRRWSVRADAGQPLTTPFSASTFSPDR